MVNLLGYSQDYVEHALASHAYDNAAASYWILRCVPAVDWSSLIWFESRAPNVRSTLKTELIKSSTCYYDSDPNSLELY
jgi:hypothetical protein